MCKVAEHGEHCELLILVSGLTLESLGTGVQLGGVGLSVCEARMEGGSHVPDGGGAMARQDLNDTVAHGCWRGRPCGGVRGATTAAP